ncbi:MAG: hypothetical protein HY553_20390 [Elusimicrobia bacterium]|nr:hypothetical protein [Elusimicrobiota bacterium]
MLALAVLAASIGLAQASDGFDASMADLRDSLSPAARAVGANVLRPIPPRLTPRPHGRAAGDPCLESKVLDGLSLRWTFEPEPPAFYVKLPPVVVDFGGGACEPYRPPPEAHHGDRAQAIRRFPGTKDYDLVLVTDAGSDDTGVLLTIKGGMIAVSYGDFPTEAIAAGALELPKLPVARSLTHSQKGRARLSVLPKEPR